jgi:hypothetical protein
VSAPIEAWPQVAADPLGAAREATEAVEQDPLIRQAPVALPTKTFSINVGQKVPKVCSSLVIAPLGTTELTGTASRRCGR